MQASPKARAVAWCLVVAAGLANAAGYAFDFYQRFAWFDRLLHAVTILAVTLWLALFVFGRAIRDDHRALIVLLVTSVGLAIGAVWEVAEWGFDQVVPVIKGKHDTVIDIAMDAAGGVSQGSRASPFCARPHARTRV